MTLISPIPVTGTTSLPKPRIFHALSTSSDNIPGWCQAVNLRSPLSPCRGEKLLSTAFPEQAVTSSSTLMPAPPKSSICCPVSCNTVVWVFHRIITALADAVSDPSDDALADLTGVSIIDRGLGISFAQERLLCLNRIAEGPCLRRIEVPTALGRSNGASDGHGKEMPQFKG